MIYNADGKIRTSIYFPAVSAALSSYLLKPMTELWNDKDVHNLKNVNFKFYNEGSIIGKHPWILFSAAHHYKITDLRKRAEMDPDVIVFADSGGFQLLTGVISEKKFNEKTAYDWCEAHADIFPILDRPVSPYDPERDSQSKDFTDSESKFKYCLDKSSVAAKYYYDRWIKTNRKKIILNVFSSSTLSYSTMDAWYKNVIEPYHFGHFAHGRHLGNMKHILEVFFYLLDKGEFEKSPGPHYYHLLGVSTPRMMLYIAYLQRLLNENDIDVQLIYDSSTPFRQISFGIMMGDARIEGFRTYRVSNKYDFSKCNSEYGLPSHHQICKKITNVEEFLRPFTSTNKKTRPSPKEFYVTFSLSNLETMLEWKSKCDIMINNGWDDSLFEYLGETEKNNFKLMKHCFDVYFGRVKEEPKNKGAFDDLTEVPTRYGKVVQALNTAKDKKSAFIWNEQDLSDVTHLGGLHNDDGITTMIDALDDSSTHELLGE